MHPLKIGSLNIFHSLSRPFLIACYLNFYLQKLSCFWYFSVQQILFGLCSIPEKPGYTKLQLEKGQQSLFIKKLRHPYLHIPMYGH